MWFQSQTCSCSSSARCVKTAPTVSGSHTSKQEQRLLSTSVLSVAPPAQGSLVKAHKLAKCATWECLSACSVPVEAKADATRSESVYVSLSSAVTRGGRPAVFRLPLTQFKVVPAAPPSVWTLLTSALSDTLSCSWKGVSCKLRWWSSQIWTGSTSTNS